MAQNNGGEPHPYESTTRWVEEAARRRSPVLRPSVSEIAATKKPRRHLGIRREVYFVAALAVSFANYYFMQVMVEINSLPSLIVFVPLDTVVG